MIKLRANSSVRYQTKSSEVQTNGVLVSSKFASYFSYMSFALIKFAAELINACSFVTSLQRYKCISLKGAKMIIGYITKMCGTVEVKFHCS